MRRHLTRRLLSMLPVLVLVSLLVFSFRVMLPGDPAELLSGLEATKEDVARLRHSLGLDQPLFVQYAVWAKNVLKGDLGASRLQAGTPVADLLVQRIPVSLELALLSVFWATLIAVPIGIVSAVKRDSIWDVLTTVVAMAGLSIPRFVLAFVLILLFAVMWRVFPPSGYTSFVENPVQNLRYMVLPAVSLGLVLAAAQVRMLRMNMLEVLRQDYVRTARSKGLAERLVILRHGLKNALLPFVTIVGLQLADILAGTVIIEVVFSLPGLGRLLIDAILARDFPVIQGVALVMALVFLVVNLVVDMCYGYLDPRIRYD